MKNLWLAEAWWSGHQGNGAGGMGCGDVMDGVFPLQHGDNVLLVRGFATTFADNGQTVGGYLNVQVTVDLATPAAAQSWGHLKLLYR